jgi:C4-dicarboxylate transporter DctM subunit
MMDPFIIGLLSIAAVFIAVLVGVHIAVALTLISLSSMALIKGGFGMPIAMLATGAFHSVMDYVFSVLPMFLLMGYAADYSGTAEDAYDLAVRWIGTKVRGGLAIATILANAFFAAITGVSIASAALFSKISLPHMQRHGYERSFSIGIIAASSILGMLIPPSVLFILYGILANESVGALYIAGIVPGVMLAVAYSIQIVIMVWRNPKLEKQNIPSTDKGTWEEKKLSATETIKKLLPIAILIISVLGGIYIGIFTPTEAGAVGAFLAIALGFIQRRLTLRNFWESHLNTAYISASVLFILVAAQIYSRMLTISRVPNVICEFGLSIHLPPILIIIAFLIAILLMGVFLDSTSIMLITMPIMIPVVNALGYDLIWFGVVAVFAIEIGLITPPFGMVVFTINAVLGKDAPIEKVFRAIIPFLITLLVIQALLIAFPVLSTWLPYQAGLVAR